MKRPKSRMTPGRMGSEAPRPFAERTVYVAQDEDGKVVGRSGICTTSEGFKEMFNSPGVPSGTRIGPDPEKLGAWNAIPQRNPRQV
jgi:hypothetical protein